MKKIIVLYNPAAPYHTLPLQYLALASQIDTDRYDIRIVDARVEPNAATAHSKVLELLPGAACVGVSVITGTPIKDAVRLSSLVRHRAPGVPVIWGGWHPSIFPEQCLREGYADFCVVGQGELTFRDLLSAIESRSGFDTVPGLARLENGEFHLNPGRKFTDINTFPPYDYDLIPLETYFRLKGRRQLDFYSSQGCPYRCGFCADPSVYNRRWSGLKSRRMLNDVLETARRYHIDDVVFQDENFFANQRRVIEFCSGMRESDGRFTWSATSRADQIAPLDEGLLKEIHRANLRKVVVGAESGSQDMLDMMKKDTLAEEAIVSAQKLSHAGIGADFNFIVGLPEEPFEETLKTLDTIREIKRINRSFEFNIFFFTPYPGTELFSYMVGRGYRVPQSLTGWSDIGFLSYSGEWVNRSTRRFVENFKFYLKLSTRGKMFRPVQYLAAARSRHDFYHLPLEKTFASFVLSTILHRENW